LRKSPSAGRGEGSGGLSRTSSAGGPSGPAARDAYERGYNVALVIDAMTDMNAEAHENSLTGIFPRLGETGTTDAVLALLEKSA
jgi:hypothetical protein